METIIDINKAYNLKKTVDMFMDEFMSKVPNSVKLTPDKWELLLEENKLIIQLNLDAKVASIIFGSKPHWPGVEGTKNIEEWARNKGLTPETGTYKQLAFLIARKISGQYPEWYLRTHTKIPEGGTKKHDYYDKALEELWPIWEPKIIEALEQDIEIQTLGLEENSNSKFNNLFVKI